MLDFVGATDAFVVELMRSGADVAPVVFFAVVGRARVKIMVARVVVETNEGVVLATAVAFAAV